MTLVCYKLKNSSYEEYARGVKYIFKAHPKLRDSYDSPEHYITYFYPFLKTNVEKTIGYIL